MSSHYRFEVIGIGAQEPIDLQAEDDNAARRQALLTISDLLRDAAIQADTDLAITLRLSDSDRSALYEVTVEAAAA